MKAHRKIACIWVVMLVFAWIAGAQVSKKESPLRTVRGIVTDKSETPLPNSVVFLKNLRTNAVAAASRIRMATTGSVGWIPTWITRCMRNSKGRNPKSRRCRRLTAARKSRSISRLNGRKVRDSRLLRWALFFFFQGVQASSQGHLPWMIGNYGANRVD